MVHKLVWLALAGACGALARYGLAGAVHHWCGSWFPWGTAFVNVLGCLLFGVFWALASERATISSEMRTVILVGFLGSFTTFSTFVSETSQFLMETEVLLALANMAIQVLLGIAVFYLGLSVGRII